jgi:ComF family protein
VDRGDTKDAERTSGLVPRGSTEPGASAFLPSAWRRLAGFVLPSVCHACGDPLHEILSGGVCSGCWRALPQPQDSRCLLCDEPIPAHLLPRCGRCLLDPPAFDRLRGAAPYRGSARRILLAFKFRDADYLAPRLADLMMARLGPAPSVDVVLPVPAFGRLRLFSPPHAAEQLAIALARRLGRPFSRRRLTKRRKTRRQSGLPLARRLENVRGAFDAAESSPARILLVDDVATTGSTARACAAALKKAGAREVHVWCFARAARE